MFKKIVNNKVYNSPFPKNIQDFAIIRSGDLNLLINDINNLGELVNDLLFNYPVPKINSEIGVMYLKNNTTPTVISSPNSRSVVEGLIQVGLLHNFEKDFATNSLKYIGPGGRFHIIATFNFLGGNQRTCGFYIGHNTDDTSLLDPDANRISESEIYANSSTPSNQPVASTIQTILNLNTNDRIFFIVQNQTSNNSITVQFLKFIVTLN